MSNTNHFVYILEDGKDIAYNEIHYVNDINDDNDHSIMAVILISQIHESGYPHIIEIPDNLLINFNEKEGNYFIDEVEQDLLNYILTNGKPIS